MSALLTPKPVDWIWPWSCTWPVVSILQWSINSMLLEQGFSMSPLLPFGHFTVGGFLVHCTMSSSISGLYTHTHTVVANRKAVRHCQVSVSVGGGGVHHDHSWWWCSTTTVSGGKIGSIWASFILCISHRKEAWDLAVGSVMAQCKLVYLCVFQKETLCCFSGVFY